MRGIYCDNHPVQRIPLPIAIFCAAQDLILEAENQKRD